MYRKRLAFCCCLLSQLLFGQILHAQNLEFTSPENVGMSSAGFAAVTERLQRHIDDGDIAGVVAAVARDGKIVYYESLGMMDIEQGKPMRDDALFRQYSMSRQITAVATLLLVQDGLLSVDDTVQEYLPQFANQRVFADSSNPDLGQTRERVGHITIANLLTHTSGLGSRNESIYRQENVRDRNITLEQMVENAARVPLFADPGTEFRYGISEAILGRVVEVVSGLPLQEFMNLRLFQPLGMTDTVFWADETRRDRLAQVYRPSNGQLLPHQIERIPFTMRPRLIEGSVGLLSTTMDFLRFSQMLLNGGELNGRRVMEPETVELVYANAVPQQAMPLRTSGYWRGSGWSLGSFNVVLDASAYSFPVSNGTIWWDGSAGTRYFIDPEQNIVTVIMAQVSPARGNGFRENFTTLVDAAISERR